MAYIYCVVNIESDRATFTWSEGPASFPPYALDGMLFREFKELAKEARERLADLVSDYLHDQERLPLAAYQLAVAGHEYTNQYLMRAPTSGNSPTRSVSGWSNCKPTRRSIHWKS